MKLKDLLAGLSISDFSGNEEEEIRGTPTLPWATRVVRVAGPEDHTSAMVLEEPLSVEVNGRRVAVLMRLPGNEKELGVGFCVSEGIVTGFDAVLTVHHCGRGLPDPIGSRQDQVESRNRVQIRAHPEAVRFDAQSDVVRLIRTGCGAVMGAGLGFLWFNTYPAQVFMGDVGALALGALLGVIAIIVRQEIVLFIMGGVFVMEAVSVMIQVGSFKTRGKRVFRMAPLHHHFELKGWPEPRVIVRFWIISLILVLIGLATLKLR